MMQTRVYTALAIIPVVLFALGLPTIIPLAFICLLASFRCIIEVERLFQPGRWMPAVWSATVLALAGVAAAGPLLFSSITATVLTFAGAIAVWFGSSHKIALLGSVGGALWVGAPLSVAVMTNHLSKDTTTPWGPMPAMMLMLPLWVADSCAMIVGKYLGKHKMAPTISPNKTWEGAAGHLIASVLFTIALAAYVKLPLHVGALVGLTIGVVGQIGDLLQSWAKRKVGLKDTGQLLPGHGGLLDRIDSFLLSAPLSALLLATMSPEMFRSA